MKARIPRKLKKYAKIRRQNYERWMCDNEAKLKDIRVVMDNGMIMTQYLSPPCVTSRLNN